MLWNDWGWRRIFYQAETGGIESLVEGPEHDYKNDGYEYSQEMWALDCYCNQTIWNIIHMTMNALKDSTQLDSIPCNTYLTVSFQHLLSNCWCSQRLHNYFQGLLYKTMARHIYNDNNAFEITIVPSREVQVGVKDTRNIYS